MPFYTGILVPVLAGLISYFIKGKIKRVKWIIHFAVVLFLTYLSFTFYGKWDTEFIYALPSLSFLGDNFSVKFTLTKMGWLFLFMSNLISLIHALFSLSKNDKKHDTGISPLWMILLGANWGIFTSGNWIAFIIFWEVMSWTSYFIISHGKEQPYKSGIYYYVLSLIGEAAMLAGVFLIYKFTGTYDIAESVKILISKIDINFAQVTLIGLLMFAGFFVKAAIFPFYMWPAKAHADAPDDFSAFLSGVMVKYGIYGLLIFHVPLFTSFAAGRVMYSVNGVAISMYLVAWLGAITAILGTVLAILQNDMKRLMAYSTVANLGYITVGLSLGTATGTGGALLHVFNHMVFKGAIFLSLAAVKFRTGEREMHKLGGLAYRMPITFFTFLLGIIAAAGIPPLNGFPSKWLIFQGLFAKKFVFLSLAMFFASTGAFMYLFRGLHTIFLGQLSPRFSKVKEAPPLQSLSMIILMLAMLFLGIFPGALVDFIAPIQKAMGIESLKFSFAKITGSTSSVNFLAVFLAFFGAFLFVFILFLISAKRRTVDFMDNYTSGETPSDWGTTPEKYHYGYDFYMPFREMTEKISSKVSIDKWFGSISDSFHKIGGFFANVYKQRKIYVYMVGAGLLIFTLAGWLL